MFASDMPQLVMPMKNFLRKQNPRFALSLALFVIVAGFVLAVRIRHENKYEEALQQMALSQVESISIHSWHAFCEKEDRELSNEDKAELIELLNQAEMIGDNVPTDLAGTVLLMFHIKLKDGMEFDFSVSGMYIFNRTLGYESVDGNVTHAIYQKYYEWAEKYFPYPTEKVTP